MVRILFNLSATGKFLSSGSPPSFLFFSLFCFYLSLFIRLFLCVFSPFWNLTILVNDKLWVQVGVAAVGQGSTFGPVLCYPLKVGLWLCVFDPRFFVFTRQGPKDGAVDVNGCPRWLDPNKEAVSLAGGLLPILDTAFIAPLMSLGN